MLLEFKISNRTTNKYDPLDHPNDIKPGEITSLVIWYKGDDFLGLELYDKNGNLLYKPSKITNTKDSEIS